MHLRAAISLKRSKMTGIYVKVCQSKLKVMQRDTWHWLLGVVLALFAMIAGAFVFLMSAH